MSEICIMGVAGVHRSGTSGSAPAVLRLEIGTIVAECRMPHLYETMDAVRRRHHTLAVRDYAVGMRCSQVAPDDGCTNARRAMVWMTYHASGRTAMGQGAFDLVHWLVASLSYEDVGSLLVSAFSASLAGL